MTIGEKIKTERKKKRMTQRTLAGSEITPNLICGIETGKITPSVETLLYLASRLGVPAGYFLSSDEDPFPYIKQEKITRIRALFAKGSLPLCVKLLEDLPGYDDETAFLLALCYLSLGIDSVRSGALATAKKQLNTALDYCEKTAYPTDRVKTVLPIYLSVAKNVQAPLLEFNPSEYENNANKLADFEFSRYLQKDLDFPYTDIGMKKHIEAKKLLGAHRYTDCYRLLSEIENAPTDFPYHSFVMFGVYADMEQCCKELGDFEGAYRYSTKRISLLEAFGG